jgi:guanylate kinase
MSAPQASPNIPPPAIHRRGILLVLSSPSGAGKTTITRRLLERDSGLSLSVSVSTRPPRPGEIDGRDYWFIDQQRFDEMVAQDELLEHATVFGHCYGTPRQPIEAALPAGRDIVTDIDWQGAQQLSESLPHDFVSVFVLPPSIAALEARLKTRAQDSVEVVAARMAKSAEEMSHWSEYDYVIVNRDIEKSVDEVQAIVSAERARRVRQLGLSDLVGRLRTPSQWTAAEPADPPPRAPVNVTVDVSPSSQPATTSFVISPTVYPAGIGGTVVVANSVVINTDMPDFRRFSETMGEILEHLRRSNETSPEVRQQIRQELRAGMELIKAAKPDRGALHAFLVRPLQFIGKEFASGNIRTLAAAALAALAKWLGMI